MMDEEAARDRVSRLVGLAALNKIDCFLKLLKEEGNRQNLVASSTISLIWARHVLDSVQLLPLFPPRASPILDIGTGGGFPGIILAIATSVPISLCEPRKRRADFLEAACRTLGIANAAVVRTKVDRVEGSFRTITARAVAPPASILSLSMARSKVGTRWLLPVGRASEPVPLAAHGSKHLAFHVEQSITDPQSTILIVDRQR